MAQFLPWLLCLILSAPAAAAAAGGVWILSPGDRTVVATDAVTILGTAPQGTQVDWLLEREGWSERGSVKADWGDLFEIFLLLDPGLNRVQVGEQELRLFYNPGNLEPPAGFSPQTTHGSDISRCEDCHDPLTMRLREGGYPGVCLTCHVVVSVNPQNTKPAREDPHFQKAIANCGSCHEAHVSGTPKLLKGPAEALCGACHEAQVPAPGTHPAYEEGGCAACHDAHFSGYAKILLEPLPALCQRCHSQGTDAGKPHPPLVQKGSCSLCHDPHGAGQALLRTAGKDPCAACHGEVLRHGHRGELADCTACHDPHRPLSTGLLKQGVDGQCGECHAEVAEGRTVHAALDEGCQGCHDPHSDQDVDRAGASCGQCHDFRNDAELGSLHGNLSLKPGSCGACHPPHASPFDRLVKGNLHYPLTQGKCSVCHGGGA
ncbi:MAG: cytochrome c3 family protein, partial [Proteobacteria bacterium]|nr:cytochrome c3 family protein [Pseudomonadota bacterium]